MASLKKEITKGVFWIAVAKYSGIVVQLLITAVLARLILPEAFGTITVAMVILHFLYIFSDIGIGAAIVQYKDLTPKHYSSLFTLTIYLGLVLSLILFLSSELISEYYKNETLVVVCQLLTVVMFFHSLNIVPNSLMRKNKRFKTIALRTLSFQFISGSVAIWGAFHGWGLYALLVAPILTAIGVFGVNYYNYPQYPTFRIDLETVRKIAFYSGFQFAFSFMNYFSRNLDKLIIGKFFSLEKLGYYDKSYHLMILPLQNVTFVIEPVLHPILSSLQDDKTELSHKNAKLAQLLSFVSFPIGLILFFCGGELIRIVYGTKWDAAIPVFKILALSLPLQMILSTSGAIYQAAGRTNHMFYNGLINTIITVFGFLIAARWGGTIESVAWAWDITLLVNFITSYFIMYNCTFKISSRSFYQKVGSQVLNSSITMAIVAMIISAVPETNIVISLIYKVVLILSMNVLFASLFHQYSVRSVYCQMFLILRRKR